MARVPSPTVRRRELAALLRRLRKESGLSIDQVAERLAVHPTKVSRMETAQRGVSRRDVRDLCDLYGITDPTEVEHLKTLAREASQRGWWQQYTFPYATYIGLEEEAISIKSYFSSVIHGLLQTADYARALSDGWVPRLSEEEKVGVIQTRLTRQEILTRDEDPPQFHAVLDEAVLRRQVGGPAVMRAQLHHLIELSKLPNVTIQVIPFDTGAHAGLESNFVILDIAPSSVNDVVYVEGLVGQIYLERPEDLQRYREAFESLRNTALSASDSIDLIVRVAEGK